MVYLDASPTPFHAAANAAARLVDEGDFEIVGEHDPFPTSPGRYAVLRDGALVAWVHREGDSRHTPWRIVGAHTDSPTFQVKPRPDVVKAGWQMLGVEPYGPPIYTSWLDRDLGLAGRVLVRDPAGRGGVRAELFDDTRALLRLAQLAIHLDRGLNERGAQLNPQTHLVPLWGVGDAAASFTAYLGEQVGAAEGDLLGWDVSLRDTQPAALLGRDRDLLASARLDNLASCHAAVEALLAGAGEHTAYRPAIVLFDHEEVGSRSERGAASPLLGSILERAAGGDREDYWRALAGSMVASADMAHATHPNYAELAEPAHQVRMHGGPVLKVHRELRYASDGRGIAALRVAAEQAEVPLQVFVTRSDLPCGSTIGPITAGQLGVTTVDVGAPMLSMHSARELTGVPDQQAYAALLTAFLAPA
jgi:aspartyl aminopeptidase